MKKTSVKSLQVFVILGLFTLVLGQFSCGNTQYTNKLEAQPFISPLFGRVTKTVSVSVEPGAYIDWLGFQQAADYKFFTIERVMVNGRVIQIDQPDPQKIIRNITVPEPLANTSSPNAIYNNQMLITLTYRPTVAIQDDLNPHDAYLMVHFSQPEVGTVRLRLNGFTRGINVSKCTRSPGSMEEVAYDLTEGTIDLYICDATAEINGELRNSDRGERTNLTPVAIDGKITFYKPDNETVCVLGENPEGAAVTIPNFDLPIPKGISPDTDSLGSLPVKMKKGLTAECSLTNGTDLECDSNIELEIFSGGVPVAPLTLSNKRPENPVAADCAEFGEITGEGDFGSNEVTLVGWSEVLENDNTLTYNIDGALVVAVIKLSK